MLEEISDVSVNSTDPGLVGCWGVMWEVSGIGEGKKLRGLYYLGRGAKRFVRTFSGQGCENGGGFSGLWKL